ncbi:uncharacterized protein LOC114945866 [Nylanderia fulva]|uniref:uncharacterized protein LOC114945866 n=1 Tax=Nylanderia fulva TaxID=613905 RepID=UPI0010FB65A8|nr:uncharacterized protein LOC114945866 [Nylanderia fulva]
MSDKISRSGSAATTLVSPKVQEAIHAEVNDVSKKDAYPLPNMNGILDNCCVRRVHLDDRPEPSLAYFQVPLANEAARLPPLAFRGKAYDIVIVTPTFKEHLEWLDRVLQKILAAGLTINPEKCEFCRAQVKYLGSL